MTVYGFNDRETAIKLKNMVEAGSVMGAAIGDNVFDESGGFAFLNKTEKTIPPFAILFGGEFESNEGKAKDYVGRRAYAWSQVRNDENETRKENWFFNNSMPVEPDEWGWSQAKGDVQFGFTKNDSSIENGDSVFVDNENDFRLFIESGDGGESPPGWNAKAQGKVSGEDYGTDNDVFLIPITEIKNSVEIAYGKVRDFEYNSSTGFTLVVVFVEWSSNKQNEEQQITAFGGIGYPITPGTYVTLLKSPIQIPRYNQPDLSDDWTVLNYGLTELPFPDGGGGVNPGGY